MKIKNINFGHPASLRIYGIMFAFWLLCEGVMLVVSGALAYKYSMNAFTQSISSPLWGPAILKVSQREILWGFAVFISALTFGYGVFYRLLFGIDTLLRLLFQKKPIRIRF